MFQSCCSCRPSPVFKVFNAWSVVNYINLNIITIGSFDCESTLYALELVLVNVAGEFRYAQSLTARLLLAYCIEAIFDNEWLLLAGQFPERVEYVLASIHQLIEHRQGFGKAAL